MGFADQRFDVGSLYGCRERTVEVAEHCSPVHIAFLDFIEVGFHVRCELDIEDIREALHHHSFDLLAQEGREEPTLLELCVTTVDEGRDDRRGRRWTAES